MRSHIKTGAWGSGRAMRPSFNLESSRTRYLHCKGCIYEAYIRRTRLHKNEDLLTKRLQPTTTRAAKRTNLPPLITGSLDFTRPR